MVASNNFAKMMKELRSGSHDFTVDGECCGCGQCCSNLLPMSDREIQIIKKYIKTHGIKQQKHFAPTARQTLDLTCPFMDTSKHDKKCTIYAVRPGICKAYVCNYTSDYKNHKRLIDNESRVPVDVRETFFSGRR